MDSAPARSWPGRGLSARSVVAGVDARGAAHARAPVAPGGGGAGQGGGAVFSCPPSARVCSAAPSVRKAFVPESFRLTLGNAASSLFPTFRPLRAPSGPLRRAGCHLRFRPRPPCRSAFLASLRGPAASDSCRPPPRHPAQERAVSAPDPPVAPPLIRAVTAVYPDPSTGLPLPRCFSCLVPRMSSSDSADGSVSLAVCSPRSLHADDRSRRGRRSPPSASPGLVLLARRLEDSCSGPGSDGLSTLARDVPPGEVGTRAWPSFRVCPAPGTWW